MTLCKYANIFGKSGEGAHSVRIFDIAIIDVLATILVAWIISKKFHKNFKVVLIVLFITGIIIHRVFCVRTTVDKVIFNEPVT